MISLWEKNSKDLSENDEILPQNSKGLSSNVELLAKKLQVQSKSDELLAPKVHVQTTKCQGPQGQWENSKLVAKESQGLNENSIPLEKKR